MRTTLTLDDDVSRALEHLREASGRPFKEIVNQTLREGLRARETPPTAGTPFETRTVSLGRCLIGDVVDVAEALALGEGEDYR